MVRKIYKYSLLPLQIAPRMVKTIALPRDATILHFGLDPTGAFCFWAEVTPEDSKEVIRKPKWVEILILFTGEEVPDSDYLYFTTVKLGDLMLHVYARRATPDADSY